MEPKILRFQEAARWCPCCWPKNHHLSSKDLGQLGAGPWEWEGRGLVGRGGALF